MDFNLLVTNIAALFIVLLMVAPLVLLTILVIRTSKKPPTINKERIDALEQNDNIIVEDINSALTELVNRITDLEEKIERDEQTVKGFGGKK
jgi:preprotein translocase subunit YajC